MAVPEIPSQGTDYPERTADWLEVWAFKSEAGEVSVDELLRTLEDLETGYEEDDEGLGISHLETLATEAWQRIGARGRRFGDGYPLLVEGDVVRLRHESWKSTPAHVFMLLMDVGRHFPKVRKHVFPLKGKALHRMLFEKVARASLQGAFVGQSARFGWPKEKGWPTGIDDRVRKLGAELDLTVDSLQGKTEANDKDRTLDVVARVTFSDRDPGGLIVLMQCASGKNWQTKLHEPNTVMWENLLLWHSPLVRAVAVPWRLTEPEPSRKRVWRDFQSAIVFDRDRLLEGQPDRHITEWERQQLIRWTEAAMDLVPDLDE